MSLDRPGAANSSAALWSDGKTHDAASGQGGKAVLVRKARRAPFKEGFAVCPFPRSLK